MRNRKKHTPRRQKTRRWCLARRGWFPRVICESAGTQDVDALAMKRAYLQARDEGERG